MLRAPIAIKLIDPEIATSEEALSRFIREAQAAAALRSPHVVQVLDYGVDEDVPFMAMEMLEGESLGSRLRRLTRLSVDETVRIVIHVARAIQKAHDANIVHRDLKPENIFLVRNDDEEIVKVLDFGIAKTQEGAFGVTTGSRTRTGSLMGTPHYMSPEQAQGTKTVDWRSDLWALGIIAFECLTGKRPFDSTAVGDLLLQICVNPIPIPSNVSDSPPAFDSWFQRATSRAPEMRFQSAKEMAEALRDHLLPGGRAQFSSVSGVETVLEGAAELSATEPVTSSHAVTVQTASRMPTPAASVARAGSAANAAVAPSNAGDPSSLTVGQFGTAVATPASGGGRLGAVAAVVVLVLGVAGAGGWLMMRSDPGTEPADVAARAEADEPVTAPEEEDEAAHEQNAEVTPAGTPSVRDAGAKEQPDESPKAAAKPASRTPRGAVPSRRQEAKKPASEEKPEKKPASEEKPEKKPAAPEFDPGF